MPSPGRRPAALFRSLALGALLAHVTGGADAQTFQPMNCNFGLFPPLPDSPGKKQRGDDRKRQMSARALADLEGWLGHTEMAAE